jgi:hypothetical protein
MQAQAGRNLRFTAAVLLSALAVCQCGQAVESPWVPTSNDIKELEGKVQMPKGAAPLNTFTREYAGRIDHGTALSSACIPVRADESSSINRLLS